jgi:hypothetical protein
VPECWNCKTRLLKVGDCNNLTCPKCKCKMCYICRKKVADYSHFYGPSAKPNDEKCALYTDTNSLHEVEVTDEVLGVEINEETTSSPSPNPSPIMPPKKTKPGKNCCVVECFSRAGSQDSVSFFRFPKKDLQQRNSWINAINRINHDNTTWTPKDWCRVCSKHFIGGEPSKFKDHPNYTPTLFPTKHVAPKANEDILRFQRVSTPRSGFKDLQKIGRLLLVSGMKLRAK